MTVDKETFKDLMSRFPAGVTVVTTDHDGTRHGLTVSALASVSLSPPLVLVCIDREAFSHDLIAESKRFAVSFLGDDQQAISDRFAGFDDADDRFEGYATSTLATGAPLLDDAIAWLDLSLHEAVPAGDHTVFIGRVEAGEVRDPDARPLVYWGRGYFGLEDG